MNRFGISMGVSPREPLVKVGEMAKAIEARGFEALWFIDFQLGLKDVYTSMSLAALATEKIAIGPAVTNVITRHPTVTANAITALDELSEERALLGLGVGWSAVQGAGCKPSTVNEVRAGINAFRQMFTGEEVALYGTRVQLATAHRQIPVYLAAAQPRMLRLCGETCDGLILMGAAEPDFCHWQLNSLYEGLEKAGRNRSELTIDLFVTMSINEDENLALNDVRAWATSQAATFHTWKHLPPTWERFRPDFKRAAQHYQLVEHLSLRAGHKELVSDEFVQSVAIAGNRRTCIDRLNELARLDIDRITFALLSGGRIRRLDELANHVMPALAGVEPG